MSKEAVTTSDGKRLSGNESGTFTGEVGDRLGDVFGFAPALDGLARSVDNSELPEDSVAVSVDCNTDLPAGRSLDESGDGVTELAAHDFPARRLG
nr:hypothetical protein GCM10017611_04200 [Rhodococcus wratislaviensis]